MVAWEGGLVHKVDNKSNLSISNDVVDDYYIIGIRMRRKEYRSSQFIYHHDIFCPDLSS